MENENITLNPDLINAIIDTELLERLTTLEKIRYLYYALNQLVTYSPTFRVLQENYRYKTVKKISDKSIESISFNDTEVICTHWAKIYYTLLQTVFKGQKDIKFCIEGEGHQFVKIEYNGHEIIADGTRGPLLYMDNVIDLTRCKVGMEPKGMYELDSSSIYSQKYKLFSRVDRSLSKKLERYYSEKAIPDERRVKIFGGKKITKSRLESKLRHFERLNKNQKNLINGFLGSKELLKRGVPGTIVCKFEKIAELISMSRTTKLDVYSYFKTLCRDFF